MISCFPRSSLSRTVMQSGRRRRSKACCRPVASSRQHCDGTAAQLGCDSIERKERDSMQQNITAASCSMASQNDCTEQSDDAAAELAMGCWSDSFTTEHCDGAAAQPDGDSMEQNACDSMQKPRHKKLHAVNQNSVHHALRNLQQRINVHGLEHLNCKTRKHYTSKNLNTELIAVIQTIIDCIFVFCHQLSTHLLNCTVFLCLGGCVSNCAMFLCLGGCVSNCAVFSVSRWLCV